MDEGEPEPVSKLPPPPPPAPVPPTVQAPPPARQREPGEEDEAPPMPVADCLKWLSVAIVEAERPNEKPTRDEAVRILAPYRGGKSSAELLAGPPTALFEAMTRMVARLHTVNVEIPDGVTVCLEDMRVILENWGTK
jgi:hypothetical protein